MIDFERVIKRWRTGFNAVAVLTTGAGNVETLPIRSVWLRIKLRNDGRVVCAFQRGHG